ncbi:MAG: FAD-dependent oxidoreductase, partial [Deltaproteobacteria bacterium]|nr:FAD-dependent oxidoreductase [Deltaproteobacteria bacterium]
MNNSFDIVVIGSGLGGLSAAAMLSKNGKKVALFEKHFQPGGYATTFFRDDFEFEVSLHAMSGIGTKENPGPMRKQLNDLGVTDKVKFIAMDELYRSIGNGLDITIPKYPDAALAALSLRFPNERKGLADFFKKVLYVGREVDALKASGNSTNPIPTLYRYPNLAHAAGVTVATVLNSCISDPLAKLAVGQLWGYFGLPLEKLSFLMFAVGFSTYLRYGSATIEGKSQSLSNAFVEVIRENGGEVNLSNGIDKITLKDNRVTGVITENGNFIKTNKIVSNASPFTTMTKMLEEDQVPPAYKRRLKKATPSLSSVTLYLGLSRPSSYAGIENHEVYLNNSMNIEEQYEKCLTLGAPGVTALCAYDASNPNFAPKGKGVVALTILSSGDQWLKLNPSDYTRQKELMTEMLMSEAEKTYPEIRSIVETVDISTPVTNMRYTGNPFGAIYGYENTPEQNPGFRLDNSSPIDGLWFAGAWTRPGGGFQGVISSGINVANDLLRESDKKPSTFWLSKYTSKTEKNDPVINRKITGWKQLSKNFKTVGKVIRTKYQKFDNKPFKEIYPSVEQQISSFRAFEMPMKLISKTKETDDTTTLRFVPLTGDVPPFWAGQYFNIFVNIDGALTSRPYSVSGALKYNNSMDFTIKSQDKGYVSKYLVHQIPEGEVLKISGPYGNFVYTPIRDTKDIVGIAVGSGITPLMAMIEDLKARNEDIQFKLLYGSRNNEQIIFEESLNSIAENQKWFSIHHTISAPTKSWKGHKGRIDANFLNEQIEGDLSNKTFFICGPPLLHKNVFDSLSKRGVTSSQFRVETYGPSQDVTEEKNWPDTVAGDDEFLIQFPGIEKPVSVKAGEP